MIEIWRGVSAPTREQISMVDKPSNVLYLSSEPSADDVPHLIERVLYIHVLYWT